MFLDVEKEIQAKNPEFKFTTIIQGLRFWPNEKLKDYLEKSIALKKEFPDLITGFDIVAVHLKLLQTFNSLLLGRRCKKAL